MWNSWKVEIKSSFWRTSKWLQVFSLRRKKAVSDFWEYMYKQFIKWEIKGRRHNKFGEEQVLKGLRRRKKYWFKYKYLFKLKWMSSHSLKYGHIIRIKPNDSKTHSYITSKSYISYHSDTQTQNCTFRHTVSLKITRMPTTTKTSRKTKQKGRLSMYPTTVNLCLRFCPLPPLKLMMRWIPSKTQPKKKKVCREPKLSKNSSKP